LVPGQVQGPAAAVSEPESTQAGPRASMMEVQAVVAIAQPLAQPMAQPIAQPGSMSKAEPEPRVLGRPSAQQSREPESRGHEEVVVGNAVPMAPMSTSMVDPLDAPDAAWQSLRPGPLPITAPDQIFPFQVTVSDEKKRVSKNPTTQQTCCSLLERGCRYDGKRSCPL